MIFKYSIFITCLWNGLQRLPEYHGRCYRGVYLDPTPYQVGTIFVWQGFSSSSKLLERAKGFIDKGLLEESSSSKKPLLFLIDSKSGRDITALSFYSTEEEVTFFPSTSFKVTQVEIRPLIRRGNEMIDNVYHISVVETSES